MNERLQVTIQYTYIKILTLEAPVMIAVRPAKEKDILIKISLGQFVVHNKNDLLLGIKLKMGFNLSSCWNPSSTYVYVKIVSVFGNPLIIPDIEIK